VPFLSPLLQACQAGAVPCTGARAGGRRAHSWACGYPWLMLARNCDLACEAFSAASLAACSSAARFLNLRQVVPHREDRRTTLHTHVRQGHLHREHRAVGAPVHPLEPAGGFTMQQRPKHGVTRQPVCSWGCPVSVLPSHLIQLLLPQAL